MAMQGVELKAMRQGAGLSQADLGRAIGMARETIGQMERDQAPIETRTELAVRFIAGKFPSANRGIAVVQRDVEDVLEAISQSGNPTPEQIAELQSLQHDWFINGGGAPGDLIIRQVMATLYGIMSNPAPTLARTNLIHDFLQLQRMWATLAVPIEVNHAHALPA